MKNLDETTIKELNDYCGLQILESDIQYVVPNLTKKEIEKELNIIQRKLGSEAEKREVILQYLRNNEEKVDKRRMILITLKRYIDAQEIIDNRNHPLHEEYLNQKTAIKSGIQKSRELVKNYMSDQDISFCRMSIEFYQYVVEVISSKEFLQEFPPSGERKRERESKKVINKLPNKALIIALTLAPNDSREIFKIPGLRNTIYNVIISNSLADGILTPEEFDAFYKNEEYTLNDKLDRFSKLVKTAFAGVEKYVDMDKMCLNALIQVFKNFELGETIYTDGKWSIEQENYRQEEFLNIEKYLPDYFSSIEGKDIEVTIDGRIYTTEDAKKAMKEHYIDGRYMSDEVVNEQIYLIVNYEKQASELTPKQLEYVKQYILNWRGVMSTKELKRMIETNLIDEQGVLKMYADSRIGLDNISKIKDDVHLENCVNTNFIIEQMKQLKELEGTDKDKEIKTIKRYIYLYQELYLKDKTEDEILQAGTELIQELQKQKDTKQDQDALFQNGLISERTYAILATQGIISPDDFMRMYQNEILSIEELGTLRAEGVSFSNIDIEKYIIDSYSKIREQKKPDESLIKKYITLYKALELDGLSEQERNEKADEFMMKIGEKIENDIEKGNQKREFGEEDRKKLYELEVIPIDTVVFWGEQDEVIHLLKSGDIVAKDVKRLYQNRSLILHDFQNLMKAKDMELEQKISLVNIVFSTPEDAKIRENLFENITELETTVNGNSSNKKHKTNEIGVEETENDETKTTEEARNRYLFDTAVRYNAWIESDEDVKMTTFKDGHLAVQLPNVKDGIVVIEQFYCLKKTQNGKKKMTDKYGANGYVLTKDEYETYKDRFITNNRLSRSELIDLIRELPNLEDRGIGRELRHTKHQYTKNVQKLLGIPEDLAKARTETQRQKALKRLEDSEEYTEEEKDKMQKIHMMWEEVRKSRELYEER